MVKELLDRFSAEKISVDAERQLLGRRTEDAYTKLVMSVMRDAVLYAKRCDNSKTHDDELVSLCYQELMMCAKRFDPKRGRFFPFCKAALRGRIKRAWSLKSTVRNAEEVISVDAIDKSSRDRKGATANTQEGFSDCATSLRESITGEIIEPETDLINARDEWGAIEKLLTGKLDSRERMILILHYKTGLNFSEIGKLLDVSRSLIQRIHRDSIRLMRNTITADGRLLKDE